MDLTQNPQSKQPWPLKEFRPRSRFLWLTPAPQAVHATLTLPQSQETKANHKICWCPSCAWLTETGFGAFSITTGHTTGIAGSKGQVLLFSCSVLVCSYFLPDAVKQGLMFTTKLFLCRMGTRTKSLITEIFQLLLPTDRLFTPSYVNTSNSDAIFCSLTWQWEMLKSLTSTIFPVGYELTPSAIYSFLSQ